MSDPILSYPSFAVRSPHIFVTLHPLCSSPLLRHCRREVLFMCHFLHFYSNLPNPAAAPCLHSRTAHKANQPAACPQGVRPPQCLMSILAAQLARPCCAPLPLSLLRFPISFSIRYIPSSKAQKSFNSSKHCRCTTFENIETVCCAHFPDVLTEMVSSVWALLSYLVSKLTAVSSESGDFTCL